jgi:Cu(I)/Ag(I) efflux system membrane fusion protein
VGYVQYDEDHLIHIHPRVEGWIEKLHIKAAGDTVEQGAPLYDLYAPMLVNAQEEFLLALKRNNVTLVEAARARLASLQVPASEIRRLEASRRVSQTISVTAPQSGVLDNLMVREGMFVGPGMEIMAIGQLEHIWVIGELFERQSALVQVGDQVQMHLDYLPGRSWQGQVDYIYPSLDPKTRTARVRVKFDNTDGQLRPGMFTRMRITSSPGEESLLVPLEALVRTGEQNRVVLAMGEGRFKSVAVRVGHVSDDQAQITDGLEADDQIVTSALFLIDSESSKTSDFRRMYHGAENQGGDQAKAEKPVSVWVSATVKGVMPGHRTLTLRHDPIPSWKWPAMTMDFTVADDVDIEGLATGMTLHIQVTRKGKKRYVITQIHRPEGHKP